LGGRVHVQMSGSSVDSVPATEFLLRRARIWAASRLNDWIDAAVQVDVSKGEVAARYAFIRFEFDPAFIVTTGQFKRAFDLFELTSSSQILAVERDGNIPGVTDCTGVSGVCSYSRFSEKLQHSSVDVGVLVEGDLADGRLSYGATLTNGGGSNTRETNDSKSFSGRLEWYPAERLRVGGNYSLHDFTNEVTGQDEYSPARAFDVEWGDFEQGLHVQLGIMSGDNWRAPDASGESPEFLTYQGIATYKAVLSNPGKVLAVEPTGRVSWGDPDRTTLRDAGWLMTPGVILHFTGRNRLAANVDVWRPQTGVTVWGLKIHTAVYF
jgi:Phosphate-selective porin O and P